MVSIVLLMTNIQIAVTGTAHTPSATQRASSKRPPSGAIKPSIRTPKGCTNKPAISRMPACTNAEKPFLSSSIPTISTPVPTSSSPRRGIARVKKTAALGASR
jgi:hypothetical protein